MIANSPKMLFTLLVTFSHLTFTIYKVLDSLLRYEQFNSELVFRFKRSQ